MIARKYVVRRAVVATVAAATVVATGVTVSTVNLPPERPPTATEILARWAAAGTIDRIAANTIEYPGLLEEQVREYLIDAGASREEAATTAATVQWRLERLAYYAE